MVKSIFNTVKKGAKRLLKLDRTKSFDKVGDIAGKNSLSGATPAKQARVKKRDALLKKQNKRSMLAVGGTALAVGGAGAYDVARRNKENASLGNKLRQKLR
jgi:hypothetical protein